MATKKLTASQRKQLATLESVLTRLQSLAPSAGTQERDAIDAELARPGRKTSVAGLRESPVIENFRTELRDGMIRVDSVHQLLGLVDQVLGLVLAAR